MPSFFEEFEAAPSGLSYIGKEERHTIIKDGTPITITKVLRQPDRYNPGQDRYLCIVELDGEQRGLNFGVEKEGGSRGEMLEALMSYFEKDDSEPLAVRIEQVGSNGYQILVEA